MFKLYSRRLLMVVLWLLLSIGSLRGWKYLSALQPEDPPIWKLYGLAGYLAGSWPFFLAVVTGLVVLYVLELIDHKPAHLHHTLFWVAILGIAAIAVYPFGSHDNFGYIAYAHLHAHYGLNPYQANVTEVSDYRSDPFLKNMVWAIGSPYGPLWTWLSYGLYYMLAGFGLIPLIFGFKILGLLMHLLITMFIYRLAEVITSGSGSQAAILYGTNPLAIFELVANSHNDGPAILLLLISLYLALQTRQVAGFIFAGIAAAFKLTALIAVPFLVWKALKKNGVPSAVLGAGIVAVVLVLVYIPFWTGVDSMYGLMTSLGGKYISISLPTLPDALGYKQMILPVRIVGWLIFSIWYAWLLRRLSHKNRNTLILAAGLGIMVYLLLGTGWVHRWYYLWPLTIMIIVPDNPWTKAILGQSVLLLLSYTLVLACSGNVSNSLTYLSAWVPLLVLGISRYYQRNHNLQYSSKALTMKK